MEHVLRQCLIALELGNQIGLDDDQQEAVYFGSLVAWVGCHVDAYEQTKWFGDETALKNDFRQTDFATATAGPLFMLRHLGSGQTLPQRMSMIPSFLGEGRRVAESMLENHWRASDDLMARVGLDQLVRTTVEQSFERWDGRGVPPAPKASTSSLLRSSSTSPTSSRSFIASVASRQQYRSRASEQAHSFHLNWSKRSQTPQLAVRRLSTRSRPWSAVLSTAQASRHELSNAQLDSALEAVADFVDIKSPHTIGHSRGVAALAEAAAPHYGLSTADTVLLRRAALVHDLGRLGYRTPSGTSPGHSARQNSKSPDARLPHRADARLLTGTRASRRRRRPAPRAPRRKRLPARPHRRRHHTYQPDPRRRRQLPRPTRTTPTPPRTKQPSKRPPSYAPTSTRAGSTAEPPTQYSSPRGTRLPNDTTGPPV